MCVLVSGCAPRWVEPPAPTNDGTFLVHLVRAPDESLPKILTWYTGTTLSQQIVTKYNVFLLERDIKVGDRILIPIEVVANDQAYGTAPAQQQTPNLLMEGSAPNLLMEGKAPQVEKRKAPARMTDLPTMGLETFNDDTNPDAAHLGAGVEPAATPADERVRQLQKEIADKQKELESLQAPTVRDPGAEDMPPPGLLREYEGS